MAAEEFLHLSRKEVLFRQLAELDPCAIEAAGSLAHQCVFTQVDRATLSGGADGVPCFARGVSGSFDLAPRWHRMMVCRGIGKSPNVGFAPECVLGICISTTSGSPCMDVPSRANPSREKFRLGNSIGTFPKHLQQSLEHFLG